MESVHNWPIYRHQPQKSQIGWSLLKTNCHELSTGCCKLYFPSVGCCKPKKVGKHWIKAQATVTTMEDQLFHVNTLASVRIRGFSKKKRLNVRGFAREFLRSGMLYRPGKSLKDAASLLVCIWKKIFAWVMRVFCEWRHKWKTFRPPWPTLPDPGRQPLDGSISLKFLLETRLQSESFNTLDDLLGFRVQKLWCKLVKIFD